MTFRLMFIPEKIPRTTTREQWRELSRWRRLAQKRMEADIDQRVQNLVLYGTTHPEIYKNAVEELVYPPLLVRE